MSKMILNVPFAEKDIAKALGAKWDVANKYWYVPDGLDLSPFVAWLPKDAKVKVSDVVAISDEKTLLVFLSKFSQIIFRESKNSEWITAEISQISRHKSGHYYLDLVQHNAQGIVVAKISAIIWKELAVNLDRKFSTTTNSKLKSDIKVMILVKIQFDLIHGVKLIIEDIDPAYTLGDMMLKLKKIRHELISQKIIDKNKQRDLQQRYHNIAVIAPFDAAGLGDFKKEAEILAKFNLCTFDYYYASFQGKSSASEIIQQIVLIHEQHNKSPYDMIVIIRGGGSVTDLAWLNDYELACSVCLAELPVVSGIGHRKDRTIIDEVANRAFDTPSKISAFIYNNVLIEAKDFEDEFTKILNTVNEKILYQKTQLYMVISKIRTDSLSRNQLTSVNINNLHIKISSQQRNYIALGQLTMNSLFEQDILNMALKLVLGVKQQLKNTIMECSYQTKKILLLSRKDTELLINKIIGQDPGDIVKKGFVIARTKNGNNLPTCDLAKKHDQFILQFRDGTLLVSPISERHNE